MNPLTNQIATTGVLLFGTTFSGQAGGAAYVSLEREIHATTLAHILNVPESTRPLAVTESSVNALVDDMHQDRSLSHDEFAEHYEVIAADGAAEAVLVEAEPFELDWDL